VANERITTDELPPIVRRLRRVQVMLAVLGMVSFLVAMLGGAIESRAVAYAGLIGFGLALAALFIIGIATWAIANGSIGSKPKPD
jgi:hypothetical protein